MKNLIFVYLAYFVVVNAVVSYVLEWDRRGIKISHYERHEIHERGSGSDTDSCVARKPQVAFAY